MTNTWYALRRTLPPWSFDETLPELLEYCKVNLIDEVIVKIDSEEFTHALPTVEWLDDYMPHLKKIKSELSAIDVVFSINPWVTLVHCDRGRSLGGTYPEIDLMVGHDGTQPKACCCPLSEGWRNATRELWHRYASLEPAVLWVEDDIRLHNHAPAEFTCFCPLHMREFSRKVGKDVAREELVSALLAPGDPHPYRRAWLDINRDIMIEVAGFIEKTVHEISPNTKLGLMSSLPTMHALEGRDWEAFTKALAGDQPLVARPCMCCYQEHSPRDLYDSEYYVRSTLSCLDPGTTILTEVENLTFYNYSKSARFTFLQNALSVILGADGVTLNLYDHMGTPISENPGFGEMLSETKSYMNGLKKRCFGGKSAGIQILHAAEGSYHVRMKDNARYQDLSPGGDTWRYILEPLGFPITFEDSSVVALSEQVIRGFDEARVKKILSGGVLLDLGALESLIDMGFGDLIGVSIGRKFHKNDEPLSAEEYFNSDFGGRERRYMTMTMRNENLELAELTPGPDTAVVSRLVDPDTNPKYPFVTLYKNALGGRAAVYPLRISDAVGAPFLNPARKDQLEHIVRWLSKEETPLVVSGGAYPLPFCTDQEGYSVVGVINLSLDDWPDIIFDLHTGGRTIKRIERIDYDGFWRKETDCKVDTDGNRVRIKPRSTPPALGIEALTIWW